MEKLKDEKIEGKLPTFIKNFLENSTYQIRMEDIYSNEFKQENGIPQGSVLSCTLYKLAVNSIVDNLPNHVKNSLFMDDYGVYMTTYSLRHAERILNLVLKNLEKLTKKNRG